MAMSFACRYFQYCMAAPGVSWLGVAARLRVWVKTEAGNRHLHPTHFLEYQLAVENGKTAAAVAAAAASALRVVLKLAERKVIERTRTTVIALL
jgi:hypothetical protein